MIDEKRNIHELNKIDENKYSDQNGFYYDGLGNLMPRNLQDKTFPITSDFEESDYETIEEYLQGMQDKREEEVKRQQREMEKEERAYQRQLSYQRYQDFVEEIFERHGNYVQKVLEKIFYNNNINEKLLTNATEKEIYHVFLQAEKVAKKYIKKFELSRDSAKEIQKDMTVAVFDYEKLIDKKKMKVSNHYSIYQRFAVKMMERPFTPFSNFSNQAHNIRNLLNNMKNNDFTL